MSAAPAGPDDGGAQDSGIHRADHDAAGPYDLEAHIRWRLGRFADGPVRWPAALERIVAPPGPPQAPGALGIWLSALKQGPPPCFLPLNGYDRRITWTGQGFVAEKSNPRSRRPVWFGNAFHRMGATAPMVLNHCDAQGWDYASAWPLLRDLPVFQYCRLPRQRDQVALVALDDGYAGPGSEAVPGEGFDKLSFDEKRPRLVFRGRCSGTLHSPGHIDWAEGHLRRILDAPQADPTEPLAALMRFPRPRAIRLLAGLDWADVGLVLTSQERRLCPRRALPEPLRALFRSPLDRRRLLRSRYILCIDGNDVPSGLYWALQSNSLVFRMSTGWETMLDFGLRPWEHYVPVKPDGSDLAAAFARCEADPGMCRAIIANAHRAMSWASDPAFRDQIDRATLARYGANMVLER